MEEEPVDRAAVERMQADNDAALAALALEGVQVDPSLLFVTRLDALCEAVLGDLDAPQRQRFEAKLQARYADMIAEWRAQVGRARLLQGVAVGGNGHHTPKEVLHP